MNAAMSNVRILGLSGSLRKESFNTALLGAAAELVSGVELSILTLHDIPLYDADLPDWPEPVVRLRDAVEAAEAVLIATPEYNFSIPGVLKNGLDWASRPAYASPFAGKKCGLVSASPGPTGGVRAQQHLKTVLLGMAAEVFPSKELAVGGAGDRIRDGEIVDAGTRDRLVDYVERLAAWVRG